MENKNAVYYSNREQSCKNNVLRIKSHEKDKANRTARSGGGGIAAGGVCGKDYFTVPGGSLTITGYGTAEGTQRYKISVWQKVAGGAQYVNDSTYYFKTDGQNYRCVISGLDPAASYRLTISYDSSRYYLYGGLKVEGIAA